MRGWYVQEGYNLNRNLRNLYIKLKTLRIKVLRQKKKNLNNQENPNITTNR